MAVQNDTSRIQYTGNNSTVNAYAVPFLFFENSHLQAVARTAEGVETAVTLTDHTGAGDPNGGSVRTSTAIPATSTLTIFRNVPITQLTSYQEGGDFPAASHERALDKLTQISQQLDRTLGSTIRISEGQPIPALPTPTGSDQYVLATTSGQAPSWQPMPSLSVGPITAAGSTEPRFLADRFADTVNAKDFGAVGDGLTDDYPAIQAAVTHCSQNKKQLVVPTGTYRLAQRVQIINPGAGIPVWVDILGSGMRDTQFLVDGTENSSGAFYFQKTGNLLEVRLRDFSVFAKSGTGNCGTAIHIQEAQGGAANIGSVIIDSVAVNTEDDLVAATEAFVFTPANPGYWTNGVVVNYTPRPSLTNVSVNNPKSSSNDDNIKYNDSSVNFLGDVGIDVSDCFGPYLHFCRVTSFKTGFRAYSSDAKVEGGSFNDIIAVNVKTGVLIDAASNVGIQPGLRVSGSHINFRDYGVYINKRKNAIVRDILFYHSNALAGTVGILPVDIVLASGNDVFITENRFEFDVGVDRTGIWVQHPYAGSATDANVRVVDNTFDATFDSAIRLSSYPNNLQFVEPDVGNNWFGFRVKRQIRIGQSPQGISYKAAPYMQQLLSDSFTPSIVGSMVNIDSINPQTGYFMRVGNVVHMFGQINITPTAGNAVCEFAMAPPMVVTVPIKDLVVGVEYTISFVGDGDFTLVGASANTVGTVFTATGRGVGGGLAIRNTALSAVSRACGTIRHNNTTTTLAAGGLVYGLNGLLNFRVNAHGGTNAFYTYNVSYLVE